MMARRPLLGTAQRRPRWRPRRRRPGGSTAGWSARPEGDVLGLHHERCAVAAVQREGAGAPGCPAPWRRGARRRAPVGLRPDEAAGRPAEDVVGEPAGQPPNALLTHRTACRPPGTAVATDRASLTWAAATWKASARTAAIARWSGRRREAGRRSSGVGPARRQGWSGRRSGHVGVGVGVGGSGRRPRWSNQRRNPAAFEWMPLRVRSFSPAPGPRRRGRPRTRRRGRR